MQGLYRKIYDKPLQVEQVTLFQLQKYIKTSSAPIPNKTVPNTRITNNNRSKLATYTPVDTRSTRLSPASLRLSCGSTGSPGAGGRSSLATTLDGLDLFGRL